MPNEDVDEDYRAIGRTLVASDGTPLGFGAVYFAKNAVGEDVAVVVFYGGPNQYFLRKYLPMILRGMTEFAQILRHMGVTHAYAVCDQRVPGSEKFVRWLGGELVPEAEDPNGPIYKLNFEKFKLTPCC